MEAAVRYLQVERRDAEHYAEALDLMTRARTGRAPPTVETAKASPGRDTPVPVLWNGTGVHNCPERLFTINRNDRSQSSGICTRCA